LMHEWFNGEKKMQRNPEFWATKWRQIIRRHLTFTTII
jgi:hypothetical protein